MYADDCQIYVSFKPGPNEESAALLKMEAYVKRSMLGWHVISLKLNRDKTEFLVEFYMPNIFRPTNMRHQNSWC